MLTESYRKNAVLLFSAVVLVLTSLVSASPTESALTSNEGRATWIIPRSDTANALAVSPYRLCFNCDAVPESYVTEVSASSIFHLYLNGVRIASGPALGDPAHWRYETVDLSAHLKSGENVLAAVVWSPGGNGWLLSALWGRVKYSIEWLE